MEAVGTLDELLGRPVRGKRVFVRADFNVPVRGGIVFDDTRIRASLPTLRRLVEAGARVIVASHLDRPEGRVVADLSLEPVAERLGEWLGVPVGFARMGAGDEARVCTEKLVGGEILLLENLRFEPGEAANDAGLAQRLADLADAYVLDAFASAHREHASTVGMQAFVSDRVMGDLVAWEIRKLEVLLDPPRPFVCVIGGVKVADKAHLLEALVRRADVVGIGGALAYPFLQARGKSVANSLVEDDVSETVERVLALAERSQCRLLLPDDHRVARELGGEEVPHVEAEIPAEHIAVDIGPGTAAALVDAVDAAGSVFWNGPMGIFELAGCSEGTREVALAVARCSGYSVVGGADTARALREWGLEDGPAHVSTGGAAALEFVAGGELPALRALRKDLSPPGSRSAGTSKPARSASGS